MVEELKKYLSHDEFNQVSIPTHISKQLLSINSTNLSDPLFFKLRSDLYEIISICFLDEQREDFIENIHEILKRVFELDMTGQNVNVAVWTNIEWSNHATPRHNRSSKTIEE